MKEDYFMFLMHFGMFFLKFFQKHHTSHQLILCTSIKEERNNSFIYLFSVENYYNFLQLTFGPEFTFGPEWKFWMSPFWNTINIACNYKKNYMCIYRHFVVSIRNIWIKLTFLPSIFFVLKKLRKYYQFCKKIKIFWWDWKCIDITFYALSNSVYIEKVEKKV